jgi:hypothetical protein
MNIEDVIGGQKNILSKIFKQNTLVASNKRKVTSKKYYDFDDGDGDYIPEKLFLI